MRKMIVAVDFDGCITEGLYGSALSLQDYAKEALEEMKKMGCDLILWTCRGENDGSLQEAKSFLQQEGIYGLFSKFNDGSDHSEWGNNRKILADVYIDDKCIGGWKGWRYALEWVKKEHDRLTSLYGKEVPTISKSEIISSMCMTWDHSFGLRITEKDRLEQPANCGMTEREAGFLYKRMEQIFNNDLLPILKQCAKVKE